LYILKKIIFKQTDSNEVMISKEKSSSIKKKFIENFSSLKEKKKIIQVL
jgi:hypothetical protein